MAAKRTQLYLDDELRDRIDRASRRDGKTMADVIREALDSYLTEDDRVRRPLTAESREWVGAWAGEATTHLPALREALAARGRRLDC